jgi:phosphatidylserine/phosphatidylglycerophosphate/cardiolipin synthase-like enzyme
MAQPRLSGLARIVVLVVVAAAATLVYQYRRGAPAAFHPRPGMTETAGAADFFSPADNLERLDLEQLNRAQRTIDVAMYAFTDKYMADQLVAQAGRGVRIRIYRDRSQFEDEQRNAANHHSQSTAEIFRGQSNIQLRVKGSRELMHLKAYLVDGTVLRDGSANWSPSGLKRQDNNARFTTAPAQIKAFQQVFERMWSRADNREIQ